MRHDEITCREVIELLTAYLDGALAERVRAAVESHLDACPPCRSFLDQLRAAIDAVAHLDDDAVPAELRAHLVGAFRAWASAGPRNGLRNGL